LVLGVCGVAVVLSGFWGKQEGAHAYGALNILILTCWGAGEVGKGRGLACGPVVVAGIVCIFIKAESSSTLSGLSRSGEGGSCGGPWRFVVVDVVVGVGVFGPFIVTGGQLETRHDDAVVVLVVVEWCTVGAVGFLRKEFSSSTIWDSDHGALNGRAAAERSCSICVLCRERV
jgi:hypothetical protein